MTYLSVCSGIEAASVAWGPLGWRPWAFSEIEAFPSAVLQHHYPDAPNLGDMTKFEEWPDAAIDLLVGGTPCQSFSVAGLGRGLADPRGGLLLTYLEIARRYRPRWVVWENVPGVLSIDGGRAFGTLLGGLAELGYGFAYRVLDAQYFGVPQRRRRVFVVGHLGDWRRAAAVLFERASLSGHPAPRREARQDVAGTIGGSSQSGGFRTTDLDNSGAFIPEISPALKARDHKGPSSDGDGDGAPLIVHALRGEGFDASEDGTGRGTPLVPVSVALRGRDGGAAIEVGDDLAFSLRASKGGGDKPYVLAFSVKDHGADAAEDIAPTLRAGGHDGSHANGGVMPDIAFNARQDHDVSGAVTHPLGAKDIGHGVMCEPARGGMQVRRLTVEECELLQGFPRGFTAITYRGKPAADGPRYKALGNSMAVPVMAWIGRRIASVEALA